MAKHPLLQKGCWNLQRAQYFGSIMLHLCCGRTESCVSVLGLVVEGRAARTGGDARGEEHPSLWGALDQAAPPEGLPED